LDCAPSIFQFHDQAAAVRDVLPFARLGKDVVTRVLIPLKKPL